jgi:hypothetical protein
MPHLLTMEKNSKRPSVPSATERAIGSVQWVIKGKLACGERPGSGLPIVPTKVVDQWLAHLIHLRIKSLIVMLTEDEMASYYPHLGQSLIDYYRGAGFEVRTVANQDCDGVVNSRVMRSRVRAAFDALPKPVLVHCNAGLERSKKLAIPAICKEWQKRGTR